MAQCKFYSLSLVKMYITQKYFTVCVINCNGNVEFRAIALRLLHDMVNVKTVNRSKIVTINIDLIKNSSMTTVNTGN